MNAKELLKKWSAILKEGGEIKNPKRALSTALMLENQSKYLSESSSWTGGSMDPNGAGYVGNAEFHKIAIPMVRRTFPELIAHEIVGVQPLTAPVGLAFALRFVADQDYLGVPKKELGYNNIDPYYTGDAATSGGYTKEFGEALGSKTVPNVGGHPGIYGGLGIGTGAGIKEVSMTLEKAKVEAKTRKLRSRWSLEVAQDLKAMHGLDLEEEMMDILAYEITAEIDRELIGVIRSIAATNAQSEVVDYVADLDGRWEAEKYRNVYNLLIRKANRIAIDTRRGSGNFVVTSPNMAAVFEATSAFTIAPVDSKVNTAPIGVAKLGTLDGRITVYRDTFAVVDDMVVGYKGSSEYDTGIIYLPYIQLMVSKTVYEDSFHPTVGLMSRYAIHQHIFGAKNYYIRVVMDKLNQKV